MDPGPGSVAFQLPPDPSGLDPEWGQDSSNRDPNGGRYLDALTLPLVVPNTARGGASWVIPLLPCWSHVFRTGRALDRKNSDKWMT